MGFCGCIEVIVTSLEAGELCLMPGQAPSFPQAGRFPLCLCTSPQLLRKMESWGSGQETETKGKVKSPLCTAVITEHSTLLHHTGRSLQPSLLLQPLLQVISSSCALPPAVKQLHK